MSGYSDAFEVWLNPRIKRARLEIVREIDGRPRVRVRAATRADAWALIHDIERDQELFELVLAFTRLAHARERAAYDRGR